MFKVIKYKLLIVLSKHVTPTFHKLVKQAPIPQMVNNKCLIILWTIEIIVLSFGVEASTISSER